MKKSLKVYLVTCGLLVSVFVISMLITRMRYDYYNDLLKISEEPALVERILNVDLPDISSVESGFTIYNQILYFSEPLSVTCIEELEECCDTENTCWSKFQEWYSYDGRGMNCSIYDDYMDITISYPDVLFPEQVVDWLFFLGIPVLFIWGVVLCIKSVIRKVRNNRPSKE